MKSASKGTQVLVGLIAMAVIGGLMVLAFGGQALLSSSGRTITADFDNVLNVVPYASEVRVAGIQVGEVTAITSGSGHGIVTMSLDENVDLRTDTRARLRLKSFLGEKYIDLEPGSAGQKLTATHLNLDQTGTAPDLGSLLGNAGGALDIPPDEIVKSLAQGGDVSGKYAPKAAAGVTMLRQSLDKLVKNQGQLWSTLDQTNNLLTTLNAQSDTLGQIENNAKVTIEASQKFWQANKPKAIALVNDVTTLQNLLVEHKGDLSKVQKQTVPMLNTTRTLVRILAANITTGKYPVPFNLYGIGTFADQRPPAPTPGETGANKH